MNFLVFILFFQVFKKKRKMKINNRISLEELEQLVFQLHEKLNGQFLQNIYHYDGNWLLKWNNNISLVYDKNCLWVGTFPERETKIHSVCTKIRKELHNAKCLGIHLKENDRTVVMEFFSHFLIFEFFAKGNIMLVEKETCSIIVLTRIHEDERHGKTISIKPWKDFSTFQVKSMCLRNNEISFQILENENNIYPSIFEAMTELWKQKNNLKLEKKPKKEKKTKMDGLERQEKKLKERLQLLNDRIENDTELYTNYELLGKLCSEKKKLNEKLEKLLNHFETGITVSKKSETIEKKVIQTKKWYHKYHWWYTKNNFLVVGGKNASQNENLVKTYLKDSDYYFHIENSELGSGSFILFSKSKEDPTMVDFDETAEGVFSLSGYWNQSKTGKVFYVHGSQVSKTPQTGEFVTKGSFIIRGKKNFINVQNTTMGYCLVNDNELMCAPFRIIHRTSPKYHVKITNGVKKWKTKDFVKKIEGLFKIEWTDDLFLFQKPCILQYIQKT